MYLNTLRYDILPLHSCASHTLGWSASPSHTWLPVRGWRHALSLYWDPEPHDTEHRDHSFQLVHTPSKTWNNCYISRHVPQYYKVEKFLSLHIQVCLHVSGNEPKADNKSLSPSTFSMGNGEMGVYIEKKVLQTYEWIRSCKFNNLQIYNTTKAPKPIDGMQKISSFIITEWAYSQCYNTKKLDLGTVECGSQLNLD